jgi:hypothetical protein
VRSVLLERFEETFARFQTNLEFYGKLSKTKTLGDKGLLENFFS